MLKFLRPFRKTALCRQYLMVLCLSLGGCHTAISLNSSSVFKPNSVDHGIDAAPDFKTKISKPTITQYSQNFEQAMPGSFDEDAARSLLPSLKWTMLNEHLSIKEDSA